jgi:FdrA protein
MDTLGLPKPDLIGDLPDQIEEVIRRLDDDRHAIRGLFSGGTLCYEAQTILAEVFGQVYSNVPLDPTLHLPFPPGASVCLDLGEEEYTRGHPHPMIDLETRVGLLREHARDETVAVLLLDVVIGYGAHPDPAGVFAPICAEIIGKGGGPAIVAYCLGTDQDPQNLRAQRQLLRDAGCVVPETAARAALAAASIATRGAVDVHMGL